MKDHLGNTRVSFNESAVVQQTNFYYPFGIRITGSVPGDENKYLYKGKELFDDNGLYWYHYGARFYNPQIGQWHTMDPADQYHSPYTYVGNDPTNYIDPSGMNGYKFYSDGSMDEIGFDWSSPSNWGYLFGYNEYWQDDVYMGELAVVTADFIPSGSEIGYYESYNNQMYWIPPDKRGIESAFGPVDIVAGAVATKLLSRIATAQGGAYQSFSIKSILARRQVNNDATLYRMGTTTKSAAGEAQYWSLKHPMSSNYASKMGIPKGNINNANFISTGTLKNGGRFITRPAPAVGSNLGGGIEVVVPPGGVNMNTFSVIK